MKSSWPSQVYVEVVFSAAICAWRLGNTSSLVSNLLSTVICDFLLGNIFSLVGLSYSKIRICKQGLEGRILRYVTRMSKRWHSFGCRHSSFSPDYEGSPAPLSEQEKICSLVVDTNLQLLASAGHTSNSF